MAKYENGSVYDGEFENDARQGWGLQKFSDGSRYEGTWHADAITGQTVGFRVYGFLNFKPWSRNSGRALLLERI